MQLFHNLFLALIINTQCHSFTILPSHFHLVILCAFPRMCCVLCHRLISTYAASLPKNLSQLFVFFMISTFLLPLGRRYFWSRSHYLVNFEPWVSNTWQKVCAQ
jgi:hypothetical protein